MKNLNLYMSTERNWNNVNHLNFEDCCKLDELG
jgi:hypothetical protein